MSWRERNLVRPFACLLALSQQYDIPKHRFICVRMLLYSMLHVLRVHEHAFTLLWLRRPCQASMGQMLTASLPRRRPVIGYSSEGKCPVVVQVRLQGPGGLPNGAGLVAERSASWQPPAPIGRGPNSGHVVGQATGPEASLLVTPEQVTLARSSVRAADSCKLLVLSGEASPDSPSLRPKSTGYAGPLWAAHCEFFAHRNHDCVIISSGVNAVSYSTIAVFWRVATLTAGLPLMFGCLPPAGVAKAPDGSFWVVHRGDRVRDAATDDADGAGRTVGPPSAAQAQAAAPVQGPTLLRIDADTGAVLQAGGLHAS